MKPLKTHYEIAAEYGISPRTFKRWCDREGLTLPQGPLTPKWQKVIYDTFGLPFNLLNNLSDSV